MRPAGRRNGPVFLDCADGSIEHAKIGCVSQHWFAVPLERLVPLRPDHPGLSPGWFMMER